LPQIRAGAANGRAIATFVAELPWQLSRIRVEISEIVN
jgi:hypothetical protein